MGGNPVESVIGAVVLLVAGGFLAFAYSNTDIGAIKGYPLYARFDRIDGLTIGADVRMSGIKIGTVTGERLDPQTYDAVVTLSVASSIQLPDDTATKIASEGLLGGNYLSVQPGGSEDMLAPGDEIQYTQGSIDLMSLIGQALFNSGAKTSKAAK